ncbi:alpha/beta hydrolase family protein [Chryseobacterium arthrosphaerae]|uniref:alpha/beta hydrolase family protein n=1 Tax=Chryseobacterium arthrosphaerae TaxID=651561 RepID=UPI003D348652
MDIKMYLLAFLLLSGYCFSQNIDSVDSVYRQYYETAVLTTSPAGRYAVLNHTNTYGKDEDELFDIKAGKGIALGKHQKYQFLGDDVLLMHNRDYSRFQNVKTGQYQDIAGSYTATIAEASGQVVLYNTTLQELLIASTEGKVLWRQKHVNVYQLNEHADNLVFASGNQLGIRDLKNQKLTTYNLESGIQWLSSQGNRIYCANIKSSGLELYVLDVSTHRLTRQIIVSPEAFEFAPQLRTYFEIREDGHFIFPLYLKSKMYEKQDPDVNISYTNRSSKEKFLHHHLGIFNIMEKQWEYQPDVQQSLPVYKFLNEKGDFIVYDQSDDMVEDQQNVVADLTLMLDYGKRSHLLPGKRVDAGNYLWDRGTGLFVYFDQNKWMFHDINKGFDQELLPANSNGWESQTYNGLVYAPEEGPIKIKGSPAMMISNQFDYFIVNLNTRQLERITSGEAQNIKYQLQLSKKQYPRSPWNIQSAEIDLGKEMTFKLFNHINYESGFATYQPVKNKMKVFRQGHYKEIIPYTGGFFLTSHFALEPFKLTKFEKGKYSVVYESLKTKNKVLDGMQYRIFQYTTSYGTANAALLYPLGYDRHKRHPMIVNIYEKKSRDLLYFLPPYLRTRDGFNYMHYLMNGYIVLLPDLQYEIANIKNSVIASLEKSIDIAQSLAAVDSRNIGVLGLSYGGYETGLAVSNSRYFKTGVAGVMISDLVLHALSYSEFNSAPNYVRTENQQMRMKNSLFESWSVYLENSPAYHIKNVKVPVLIWTGLKDKNVLPLQSKMFFTGMKRLGKKAVLLEYPNETHNILSAHDQLDLDTKIWQWFDHYLKDKAPAEWIQPVTE